MNKLLLVSDALVRALGWALAHSLWQATAVALLLLIILPRLKTAWQRYWVAYGGLTLVFLAAVITFAWNYKPSQILDISDPAGIETTGNVSLFFAGTPTFNADLWQNLSTWLEMNHALLVAIWLLGFGFFMLRLGTGLWQVQRLRTLGVSIPEAGWLERFDLLRQRLGFSRAVNLLESTLVQTPVAIGWLKPLVLLPLGLVNRLSVAEVEAVLAHELAHIARRDWIFNLLQALVESFFYYHPAVWWISMVVRRERENCCDDAALAATGNPIAFAKALVQVQEMAAPVPVLALGLSGPRRRPLLERVRRILNQPQQRQHQAMEKITATVILLAFLALVGLKANSVPTLEAAFSQISDIPGVLFGNESAENETPVDSLPKPKSTRKITREEDDQKVEAEYQDNKLTRLIIDGKEIPASEFEAHESLTEELLEESEMPEPPSPPDGYRMAPRPEFWEVPATPRAFGYNGASALSPMTPLPNMKGPVLVFSGKDDDGNAIITLDNNGESTELIVKGDQVFVNGKKLEKGESLDMPGLSIGSNGQFISPPAFDAYSYNFFRDQEAAGLDRESAQKMRDEYLEQNAMERDQEIKLAMEERKHALKEYHEVYEHQRKLAKEEMKKSQDTWKKEQKRWEKEQKNWEKDQQKWQAEQQVWEAKHQVMQEALKRELLKDNLITNPDNFSLELNNKLLKVNKKTQPEALHKKYLELIESMTGQKLNGNGSYMYNFSEDDK